MATYKVIQDVEAEDKILGPLTLKQLIFAIIVAGFGFGAFRVVTITGSIFAAIPFLPFMIIFGALAAPLGKNQPTEVWLAAQIHFLTKPKVRLWDQSDLKEVVHITVPKKEHKNYTDGLSQVQVKSRLSALASTLDSHGWAVKNVNNIITERPSTDDRLLYVQPTIAVPEEPATADIFAPNGTEAREFDVMMQNADAQHKQQIKLMMQQASAQAPSAQTTYPPNQPASPPANLPNDTNIQPPIQTATSQPQLQPAQQGQNYQAYTTQEQANTQQSLAQPQLTNQEQELYNQILEQKHLQDKAPAPHNNHKVILPTKLADGKNEEITRPAQTNIVQDVKSTTLEQTNKINNDTITKEAYAKNSTEPPKSKSVEHKPKPKNTSDEVIIELH